MNEPTTHNYQHNDSGRGIAPARPMSRISREPGDELRDPTTSTPTSSLLQERLQRERSERQATRLGGDLSASTGDIRGRDVQYSPVKRSATAMGRQSLIGGDDIAKDGAGMGARQMEKTLETLHKQNFDLKLELFHRREKGLSLEVRNRELESQHSDMLKLQDDMIREMGQKDKALEEAVSLIVGLEARIEDLVRERDMVRLVEADGAYRHSPSGKPAPQPTTIVTPKVKSIFVPRSTDDTPPKTLGRMPSFLSERSHHTENLRNVVLKGRGSIMHMRKVSESSTADPSDINRIASPSLSVLSESSFVSIYGIKDGRDKAELQPPADVISMDRSYADRSFTTTKTKRESLTGGARLSGPAFSINNIIDTNSPLQKLERLEGRMATDDLTGQPVTNRGRDTTTPNPRSTHPPPQAKKTKQEKREALQRVLTNYPQHRDFSNPQAFPPTPDTVSSSTLRKQQNLSSSQDSLMKQGGTVSGDDLAPREPAYTASSTQQAPNASFSKHRPLPLTGFKQDPFSDLAQLAHSLPPRPHSAAETTSTRNRANSLRSDSDSDGGADARSELENDNFDYWMRESMKPNEYQTNVPQQAGGAPPASPDLFSFPVDSQGWEADAMFGALKGHGYLGSPVPALKRDPIDEITSSLQMQQAEVLDAAMNGSAPPTPDRRSSLHARTGSTNTMHRFGSKLWKSPVKGPVADTWAHERARSNSVDTTAQGSALRMPPRQSEATAMGKRSHYPPISGQASKGRSLGLNTFFKRSGSESFSVPSSATEGTFPIPTPAQLQSLPQSLSYAQGSGRSTVPPPATMSWWHPPPGVQEDELSSATPPPIMRSRGHSLVSSTGGMQSTGPTTPQHYGGAMPPPSTPTTVVPVHGGQVGTTPNGGQSAGKKKWLNLGRMGNLKNRMG